MSMWYELAGVLILKLIAWPRLTLIEVAKPWIVGSPTPATCQSEGGSPGFVFSQATLLVTGAVQGSAAEAGPLACSTRIAAAATTISGTATVSGGRSARRSNRGRL